VATVTSIAVVLVTTDSIMLIICLGICMASQTAELREITSRMAVRAGIPFIFMRTSKNREVVIIVFKIYLTPLDLVVTIGTLSRETHRQVRRIIG
jgi:hypothetical protein